MDTIHHSYTLTRNTEADSMYRREESATSQQGISEWVLDKLKSYAYDRDISNTYSPFYHYQKGYTFHFGYYYLIILYDDEYIYNNGSKSIENNTVAIPIADIFDIDYTSNTLSIITKKESVSIEHNKKNTLTNSFTIPFRTAFEADLGERMKKAFFYLKTFYQPPTDN